MADKKVMLCCAGGMSTSLLVTKMQEEAKKQGLDWEIFAVSATVGQDKIPEVDCVLLGPQMGYVKGNFEKIAAGKVPVAVIPMKDYGMMNGKAVVDFAKKEMGA